LIKLAYEENMFQHAIQQIAHFAYFLFCFGLNIEWVMHFGYVIAKAHLFFFLVAMKNFLTLQASI
jgi:hypothetical protein